MTVPIVTATDERYLPGAIVRANVETLELVGMNHAGLINIQDGMGKTVEYFKRAIKNNE